METIATPRPTREPPERERLRAAIREAEALLKELGRLQVNVELFPLWERVHAELETKRARLAELEAT